MVKRVADVKPSIPQPEAQKKKRERNLANEKKRLEQSAAIKKKNAVTRKKIFLRAQKYAKQLAADRNNVAHLKKQAEERGNFYVEPEPKLGFAVRVRGQRHVDPKSKKILDLLRLRQVNNGVFIKLNKASINMLRLVEPYVAYGYLDYETTRALIYKRGYAKVNGQRIPIVDNSVIEKALGEKYDVLCVEDVVNQIYNVGPHFKEVNNFLWPFKLRTPKGGYESIKKHFILGGSFGNREEYMSELIQRQL
jgi:large subunit ribosomal protein L7e